MSVLKMEVTRVVLSILMVIFLGLTAKASWANELLTDNDIDDTAPQISGKYIAWQGMDPNADWEIYLYDGSDIHQLTDNDTDDTQPHLFGKTVVWQGIDPNDTDSEIFLYNGTEIIQVSENSDADENPYIHGHNVVWQSWDGNDWEIFVYNLICDCLVQLTDNDTDDTMPRLYGNTVVWQHWDGNDWEIMTDEHDLEPIEIGVKLTPRTLNLSSKGKWINCKLNFDDVSFNGHDVDLTSIKLEDQIIAEKVTVAGNGKTINLKFDRSDTQDLISDLLNIGNGNSKGKGNGNGNNRKLKVELMVTGMLNDETSFQGFDSIHVLDKVKHNSAPSTGPNENGKKD